MSEAKNQEIKKTAFTKEQILKSKKYATRKDILVVLLEDSKAYTIEEVDKAINDFMKKAVK